LEAGLGDGGVTRKTDCCFGLGVVDMAAAVAVATAGACVAAEGGGGEGRVVL